MVAKDISAAMGIATDARVCCATASHFQSAVSVTILGFASAGHDTALADDECLVLRFLYACKFYLQRVFCTYDYTLRNVFCSSRYSGT